MAEPEEPGYVAYPRQGSVEAVRPRSVTEYDALCRAYTALFCWLCASAVLGVAVILYVNYVSQLFRAGELPWDSFAYRAMVWIPFLKPSVVFGVAIFAVVRFNRATSNQYSILAWGSAILELFLHAVWGAVLPIVGLAVVGARLKVYGLRPFFILYRKLDIQYHRMRLVESLSENEPQPLTPGPQP